MSNDIVFDITVFKTAIEEKLKSDIELFKHEDFKSMTYSELFSITNIYINKYLLAKYPLNANFANSEIELRCLSLKTLNDQLVCIKETLTTNSAILGRLRIELLTICSNYNWIDNVIKKFRDLISEPTQTPNPVVISPTPNPTGLNETTISSSNIELSQFIKNKINAQIESLKLIQSSGSYLNFTNNTDQPKTKPQLQFSDNDVDNFGKIFNKYTECKTSFDNTKSEFLKHICKYFELLMIQKCLQALIDLRKLQCPEEAELDC
jgi:hypothetical protein